MSYGLSIKNPSSQLVLDSNAKGLTCIGKATPYGAVVQTTGSATAASPGRRTGYSVYRINHSGDIIVATDLPLNKRVGIISITQPVAGTWEITCHCGDTPDADDFDTVEYALDVWAFGFIGAIAGSYGLALYDSTGALSHDLSRPNMLFPRSYVPPSLTVNSTIPSLTKPVAVGANWTNLISDNFVSGNTYSVETYRGSWKRTASTTLTSPQYRYQQYRYLDVEPRGLNDGDVYPASCFILEGSTLP